MNKYIFLSFGFLAWAAYEYSGGTDFKPTNIRNVANVTNGVSRASNSLLDSFQNASATSRPDLTILANSQDASEDFVVSFLNDPTTAVNSIVKLPVVTNADPSRRQGNTPAILQPIEATAQGILSDMTNAANNVLSNEEAQQTLADIRTVAGNKVNLRNGPGTDFGVLSQLPHGAEVQVLQDPNNGWVKLRLVDENRIGWVAASLLTRLN